MLQLWTKLRSGTEKQLVRELNAGMDRMEVGASVCGLCGGRARFPRFSCSPLTIAPHRQASVAPYSRFVRTEMKKLAGEGVVETTMNQIWVSSDKFKTKSLFDNKPVVDNFGDTILQNGE